MSKSNEMALRVSQEQFEQDEQARDMQEILDQQAHQQQLQKKLPARSEFDIDKINAAIRKLNQLNKGIL
jgi:flagellar motility protein MotE (MotC chaperone)|tara:strand:- start:338 stop:544 length:207 start_codon:yes stop_codon:yes gene_type:complete